MYFVDCLGIKRLWSVILGRLFMISVLPSLLQLEVRSCCTLSAFVNIIKPLNKCLNIHWLNWTIRLKTIYGCFCAVWFVSMLQRKSKWIRFYSFLFWSKSNQIVRRLFEESAEAFSIFILVQLMSSMLMLSGSIFQLDLVQIESISSE